MDFSIPARLTMVLFRIGPHGSASNNMKVVRNDNQYECYCIYDEVDAVCHVIKIFFLSLVAAMIGLVAAVQSRKK